MPPARRLLSLLLVATLGLTGCHGQRVTCCQTSCSSSGDAAGLVIAYAVLIVLDGLLKAASH